MIQTGADFSTDLDLFLFDGGGLQLLGPDDSAMIIDAHLISYLTPGNRE